MKSASVQKDRSPFLLPFWKRRISQPMQFFEVALVNGVITLTPKLNQVEQEDIMAFAGIFKGVWGDTPAAVSKALDDHRDEK